MPMLFRWLMLLTLGLVGTALSILALAWYFGVRSLPAYDATLALPGLTAPVEIVRSTQNVPHILAAADTDAFFALGLVHAQDRLWQMTVLRRAAQGRLSEVFGPRTLAADDLARRLTLARDAEGALAAQDGAGRAALRAYADGVNAWIGQVNAGARGRGAPEFFAYPSPIAAWQPADSLAILKLLGAASSGALAEEVLAARLSLALPGRGPQIIGGPRLAPHADRFPGARFRPPADPGMSAALPVQPGGPAALAGLSGVAFAVPPARTAMGGAILAAAPEAPLTAPALFYLARLDLDAGPVIGATIPGLPAVLSGRSDRLAWALVPAGADDVDLVIEEVDPGDSARHRTADGWAPFATRREVLRLAGTPDQAITLRATAAGPVLPPTWPGLAAVTPLGHVAALAWAGAGPDDAGFSALLALMAAPDAAAAARALAGLRTPVVSATLADAAGVRTLTAGALPRRDGAHQTGGRMPAPGWVPGNRWRGTAPAATPAPKSAPAASVAVAGGPTDPAAEIRLGRLTRLLDAREVHSRDSLTEAQLDIVSPAARRLLPLVGANLWFTGEPAAPGTPERRRQDALRLLAEWDGAMNEHLPEPLIHAAWMAALQDRLMRDEIGPLADAVGPLRPAFVEAVFRDVGGAGAWCDVIQSAPVEDCTTIARQALDAALVDLVAAHGPDLASWRWGDAHPAIHRHPALGDRPALGWIVNLVQSVSGGDFTLARAATPPAPAPGAPATTKRAAADPAAPAPAAGAPRWHAATGPVYRQVVDLGDPDSSVFIIATGQSGHPLSRHYDDLAELWRRGEWVPMTLDPALARAAAVGVTRLVPADP